MHNLNEKLDNNLRVNIWKSLGDIIQCAVVLDFNWSVGTGDAAPNEVLIQTANDAHDVEETNDA
jgi:hypothetical protein